MYRPKYHEAPTSCPSIGLTATRPVNAFAFFTSSPNVPFARLELDLVLELAGRDVVAAPDLLELEVERRTLHHVRLVVEQHVLR